MQAELTEIRKQREALQRKLQTFEDDKKKGAYQSPARAKAPAHPHVVAAPAAAAATAAAPSAPSLSRNNSGSGLGGSGGKIQLPDAFAVPKSGPVVAHAAPAAAAAAAAANVVSRKPVPLAAGAVVAAPHAAQAPAADDSVSAKDRVLREKERRKREEEERRQHELAAARHEVGSQRNVAQQRNQAMYRGSQSASTSPRGHAAPSGRASLGGGADISETQRLEMAEQYDHFEIEDETLAAAEEEAVHELEAELRHYTQHIDHMRSSLREQELRLELQDDEVLDAVGDDDDEYKHSDNDAVEDDAELAEGLADRFRRLKAFCEDGLGQARFAAAYPRLRAMRQQADGVQDEVLEMELLTDVLGDEDAHRWAKPLDQLFFIESNFI